MKTLIRVGAVLAAVAFCVPALACSDMMQQTTAQAQPQQQPTVAKAQPAPARQTVKKQATKAQTKVAKVQAQKVASAN